MEVTSKPLDSEVVVGAVSQRTGLDVDLDDDSGIRERLVLLLTHLNEHHDLDDQGRAAALETIVRLLSSRTMLLADRVRYPEIDQEEVTQPIFVLGMGRSGTTLMQSLLGEQADSRVPRYWEVAHPSPPPGISVADDDRIVLANDEVRGLMNLSSTVTSAHPYLDVLGSTPMECAGFAALDLKNTYGLFYYKIPAALTVDLGGGADAMELYRWQHAMLQNLQWQREPKRWVLKGLHHHATLDALKAVFPDSVVIWMHRDPLKVVPSMLELLISFYESVSPVPIDRRYWGHLLLALIREYIDLALSSQNLRGPGVVHVLYADFVENPAGTIRSIYERADLKFDDADERAIQQWLGNDAHSGTRHGKFNYSLDPFGMTPHQLEDVLGHYRAAFDIPYEGGFPC